MPFAFALLLAGTLPAVPALPNLDFGTGKLDHWIGDGFYVTSATGNGPSLRCGVCSSDTATRGRTALLHRTFVIPPGAGAIAFTAAVVRPAGLPEGPPLEVTLEAAERQYVARQVRTANGWRPAPRLLPFHKGRAREYLWPVENLIGRQVRIVLHDADDRRGCYLFCSGFRILSANERNSREFAAFMLDLQRRHRLAPMTRLDSKHFLAISNTADEYSEERLYNCETIYAMFFPHFRKKGFRLHEPSVKLMLAIFDSQSGFESYLGHSMSSNTTGVYHTPSNRLLVYDYASNRSFAATRKKAEETARQMRSPMERRHFSGGFSRLAQAHRADTNLGTVMHEVGHQLSFNSGLLNREGDVPLWLAEGLACYCEATVNGSWQGIGEANPPRSKTLAGPARGERPFLPLHPLLANDDWMRKAPNAEQVLLGYAQSWALFRMLMERHPGKLRAYLALLHDRRTPENRLADWCQIFGTDVAVFERQYHDYLRALVRHEVRGGR